MDEVASVLRIAEVLSQSWGRLEVGGSQVAVKGLLLNNFPGVRLHLYLKIPFSDTHPILDVK